VRIFILPSWCPTADMPLAGTFFIEQAHALAQQRPNWTIAICQFDLDRSRVPWRPWHFLRFLRDWAHTPPMSLRIASTGLHEYHVWKPYFPRFGFLRKWTGTADALSRQAKIALEDFIRRNEKPDLIHAHAVYPGGAAAVALGREFGIPVGLTEHLGPFPPLSLCMPAGNVMPIISETYAAAAKHSAVSRSLSRQIVDMGLASKVDVLPNFCRDDFGVVSGDSQSSSGGFRFLSIGGPSLEKGTDLLLKAFASVHADATLDVVGSGTALPFFQKMAIDLGIEHRVRWRGALPRNEMSNVYSACDAFVLPSRSESFGVVFIEALAHGKPLIATRCGGPEDIVHVGNGLLVPIDNVNELAGAMEKMIAQAKEYYPAEVLRADFMQRFSANVAVKYLESWYISLMHSSGFEEAGQHGNPK
jgi:glycosyltransferase involved in cell wall biosynthesis